MLREKIKKNNFLYCLIRSIRKFQYHYYDRLVFSIKVLKRMAIKKIKRDNDIRYYKDIHKGERCFIIATGPSLSERDLNLLKNEITFGMNSLCKVFDKLKWETTYIGFQDFEVFEKLQDSILDIKKSKIFVGDNLKKRYKIDKKYIQYPLDLMDHVLSYKEPYNTKFSDDVYLRVYDGYTIAYSILQIAVYMGFSEIYLIGSDCNYSDEVSKRNFININKIDHTYKTAGKRIISAYQIANEHLKGKEVEIYNCTRGGMLEVFPRKNLEDVLMEKC